MNGKWRDRLPERLRGQSEVLGVALLTAVVVILVATVALFLFTDFTQEANDEELLADVTTDVTSENITIVHQGGDSFNPSNVSVILRGDTSAEFKLSDFENKPDDPSSFSPGDTWVNTDESLAGEFRILVVNEPTNTVLHDQQHEVKIQDVRIRINDEPPNDDGKFVKGPIDMPGANPDGVGNEDIISREYQIEVRYSTGEGWKKQTGGTDNLQFDSSGSSNPLSVDKKDKTGGVILASKPPSQKTTVDVSVNTNTSSDAVDEEVTSNTVTVNVFDADIDTKTTIDGITPDPGDTEGTNNATVNWRVENKGDRKFDPSVTVTFTVRDRNDNVIPATADASGFSNVEDCTQLGSGSVECDVEFQGGLLGPKELASDNGTLPQINVNVDSYTTELSVKAETTPSIIGTDDSLTKSNGINPANFEVPELTTSFDNSNQDVILKWTVKNSGSWTDRQSVSVTTDPNTGDSSSPLDNEGVTIKPGNSVDESGFSGAGGYSIQNGKTSRVKVTVTTLNSSRDTVAKSWDPANFDVTDVSAQVVRVGGSDQVRVEYNVTNTGDLTYQEQVSLAVRKGSGNKESTGVSKTLSLDPGETVSDSLTTDSRDDFSTGQNTFIVESEDTSGKDKLTIDPPSFDVTIDEAKYRFSGGTDEVAVNYSVNNTGDLTGKNDLKTIFRFYNGSTKIDTKTRSKTGVLLKGDEVKTRNVSASIDNTVDTDKVEVDVYSNGTDTGTVNDTESQTVTVTPGNLDLTIQSAESNPDGNGEMVVEYSLENTGQLSRQSDVELWTLDSVGNRDRKLDSNTSLQRLTQGESVTRTLDGKLKESDIDSGGDVDIRVNATDDAQASSEAERSVATDRPNVELENVNFRENGSKLNVTYDATNTGDVPANNEQVRYTATSSPDDIELPGVLGAADVSTAAIKDQIIARLNNFEKTDTVATSSPLGPGESVTRNFSKDTSQALDIRSVLSGLLNSFDSLDVTAKVASDDDSKTYDWDLQPPTYTIQNVNWQFQPETQSNPATAGGTYTIENTGNFVDGKQDIELYINGQKKTSTQKKLQPSGETVGTITAPVAVENVGPDNEVNITIATRDNNGNIDDKQTKQKQIDRAIFTVESAGFDFTQAAPGQPATVEATGYTVNNTGDFTGTQAVTFGLNGNQNQSAGSTQLAPGQTTSGSFSTPVGQDRLDSNGKLTVSVDTENDSESRTFDPDAAFFKVNTASASYDRTTQQLSVDWQVTNNGSFTGRQDIKFLVDGSVEQTIDRQLAPGTSDSGTYTTGITQSVLDGPSDTSFTVTVRTANATTPDIDSKQDTVTGVTPPNFDLSDVSFSFDPATINTNAQVFVSYDLSNTGDFSDTQKVELVVGDGLSASVEDSKEWSLDPTPTANTPAKDDRSLSATVTPADIDGGKIPLTIRTDDDSVSPNTEIRPDEPNFNIVDSSSSVSFSNGEASGNYEVENTGDFVATKDIEFKTDGSVQSTDTVTLAPGESTTGGFSARPSYVDPNLNVVIDSQDDQYGNSFPVSPPNLVVESTSATYDSNNQEADVSWTVENTGDFDVSQDVTTKALTDDNTQVKTGFSVSANSQRSATVSVAISSGGTQTLRVRTADDADSDPEQTDTITVEPATFDVIANSVSLDHNKDAETVDVAFEVKNTGDLTGTDTIVISSSPGTAVGSKTYTRQLNPGETFSKSLSGSPPALGINEAGDITITVSADTSDSEQFNVAGPSFEMLSLTTSDSQVSPGDDVQVTATVKNTGELTGSNYIDVDRKGVGFEFATIGAKDTKDFTFTSNTVDRSDATSITFCGGAGFISCSDSGLEFATVTVDVTPRFDSVSIVDTGSNVECSFFGAFGACLGTWQHKMDLDLKYTLDDPSFNADEVKVNVRPKDEASEDTLTRNPQGPDETFGINYEDSWGDFFAGRNCKINVEADFILKENGATVDSNLNVENKIDMNC